MRADGDTPSSSQGLYKAWVSARKSSREKSESVAARNLNRDGEIRTRGLSHPNQPKRRRTDAASHGLSEIWLSTLNTVRILCVMPALCGIRVKFKVSTLRRSEDSLFISLGVRCTPVVVCSVLAGRSWL